MPEQVDRYCRGVYLETAARYAELSTAMGDRAFGYKILYGPPCANPPMLFLGLQPGGGAADALQGEADGERTGWPTRLEYSFKPWRLASQMRKVWSTEHLDRCVGFNALFFRSPSWSDWGSLPASMRSAAEAFCRPRVEHLIELLQPDRIVVIGAENFQRLAQGRTGEVSLWSDNGRALVRSGELFGRPAFATIHLSAQISNTDMGRIREYFSTA